MTFICCKYCGIKKGSARSLRCHLQACSQRNEPLEKGTEAKIKAELAKIGGGE